MDGWANGGFKKKSHSKFLITIFCFVKGRYGGCSIFFRGGKRWGGATVGFRN